MAQRGVGVEEEEEKPDRPWWGELLLVLAGLAVVILASELTVEKALVLSELAGLKQSFVGAVIVALGTSTPELAISLRAISQGKAGLSVGNIVGSNIFDMLIPPGVAALITPLLVEASVLQIDLPFLLLVTVLIIVFLARKRGLQRWEGMTLVAVYLAYALTRLALSAINGS